jgi:hypothetical protein
MWAIWEDCTRNARSAGGDVLAITKTASGHWRSGRQGDGATFESPALPSARVLDPRVDFADGAVDEADRSFAMAAFVGRCIPELLTRAAKVTACRDHVRLRGVCPAGDDAADERQTEEKGANNSLMFHHNLLNFVS